MINRSKKLAIVLFNLGGPDSPEAVQPFLFNLFNDPSIIRLPNPFRLMLATVVSRKRARIASGIYEQLGGGSPLLSNTRAQADSLETALADLGHVKVFIAMRYWHPMAAETARAVKAFEPDEIVLLPLYPHFSTTTTASSLRVWHEAASAVRLQAPMRTICCYATEPGFIAATARLIRERYDEASRHGRPRVLFSAHGLPKKIVEGGDPYQWQCEMTASALVAALGIEHLDWVSCYQSRVGPLEWIGPATEEEIERAGADGVPVVIAPIAFVSEHSETLVEIEIEYRHLAEEKGVPFFGRVSAVGVEAEFIAGLARLVREAVGWGQSYCSQDRERVCPGGWAGCPQTSMPLQRAAE